MSDNLCRFRGNGNRCQPSANPCTAGAMGCDCGTIRGRQKAQNEQTCKAANLQPGSQNGQGVNGPCCWQCGPCDTGAFLNTLGPDPECMKWAAGDVEDVNGPNSPNSHWCDSWTECDEGEAQCAAAKAKKEQECANENPPKKVEFEDDGAAQGPAGNRPAPPPAARNAPATSTSSAPCTYKCVCDPAQIPDPDPPCDCDEKIDTDEATCTKSCVKDATKILSLIHI